MRDELLERKAFSPTMYPKSVGKSFLSAKYLNYTPKTSKKGCKYELAESNPEHDRSQQSIKMGRLGSWTPMSCKSSDKTQLLKQITNVANQKWFKSKRQVPSKKYNFMIKNLDQTQLEQQGTKIRESISTEPHTPKPHKISPRIDQYTILKHLDKGRFGSVYMAKHRKSGWLGALKVIEKKQIESLPSQKKEKIKSQIASQIKIQSCLNHPHLIQLYDFFADQHRIYLFMELALEGHLLNFIQSHHPISQESTSIIIRQIASGVSYMHSKHVFHRDLKLQNIVFTLGMAKICDFGWSIYQPKQLRTTLCGTPLYLSPQILQGRKYDNKIDTWALGTIAYQLFANQNPFKIKSPKQLGKIITDQIYMDRGSPEIKSFINFILKKNPSKRPDADIILLHPFITKYKDIETSQQICSQC